MRYMRYRYLSWKYSNKISALLLTGKMGVESFVRAGFPKKKCHEWGYYTEIPDMTPTTIPLGEHNFPRFIFIGTWDYRKNIQGLIRALKHISLPYECVLVGDGVLRQQIEQDIVHDQRFRCIGNVPNRQIGGIISCCDVLVLPSVFDGWGAVVNEALMCGTRALVSVKCGAASLITSAKQGAVFNLADIEGTIVQEIRKGIQPDHDRNELRDWAIAHLSGRSAANRFMDICKTLS